MIENAINSIVKKEYKIFNDNKNYNNFGFFESKPSVILLLSIFINIKTTTKTKANKI